MHNVQVASLVLFGTKWGLQPVRQRFRERWETIHGVKGRSRDIRSFWNKRQVVQNITVKETRYLKLRKLALLCVFQSLCSLKSFLWYAPQLVRVSILFFHTPVFLRVHWFMLECCDCWRLWHSCLLERFHFLSLSPSLCRTSQKFKDTVEWLK